MTERIVCPHCSQDRKKSDQKDLQIYQDGYYCHHCGATGIIKNGKCVPTSGKKPPLDKKKAEGNIDKALEFFEKRCISRETLNKFQITFDGKNIKFPYFWGGDLVNIKYRTLDKKFMQEKDRDKVFYNIDSMIGEKEVLITEGEIDVLSLSEATYKSVISVPEGAPAPNVKNYKTKFEYIDNCIDIFKNMERIIIAVDNDAPGITLRQELVRRLGPVRCWTVAWPEGCKDANDVLVNKGAIALVDCIFKAKPVPVEGITELSDYWEDIKADYEKGGVTPGTSTGVKGMDEVYTVREGQVTIVTGIPSHGKSSFLTAMLVNMADRDNWRFAFFSPENMPTEHFIEKILTVYIGKPFNKGYHERMTFEEMKSAAKWYHSKFKHITPPIDKHYTVTDILKRAEVCVVRYGIRGVVIDPWNEINHERSGGLNETEHISRCLSDIRKFARQFGVHVWIVAHPTKIQKDKSGKTPPPTAYDISGSSNFYNKADNIFCVYRRDVFAEKKSVEVIIQKVRFRDVGQPGVVNLVFDPITQRFNVDNFPAGSKASFNETIYKD